MKTIFFDFNGTIINDVDLCLNILNEMLKENGLEPITLERYREIFYFSNKKNIMRQQDLILKRKPLRRYQMILLSFIKKLP